VTPKLRRQRVGDAPYRGIALAHPDSLHRIHPMRFHPKHRGELAMLHYAVVFFVIALIAALFGFGGIAAGAAGIAKILFVLFAILAVASFLFGLMKR
jgi:uncharacterized membrane protein YtjA (UPF0391 family)